MGMIVLTLALLTQAPVREAPLVTSVEVRLPAGADKRLLDRVSQLISVRKGQTLSRRAVERSIESLFATARFADIEVRASDVPTGVEVIFVLSPKQTINALFVEGAAVLSREEVLAAATLEVGSEYWPERLEQAAEKVRVLYRKKGFRSAEVKSEAVLLEGGMTAGFVVREGEPSRLRAIAVSGQPGLPIALLMEKLGLRPGDVLDLTRFDSGVDAVRALYRQRHYFRARVESPEVSEEGRIVLPVVSGPRYDLVFSGNRAISDSGLRRVLAYDGEETLDESLAQRLAQRIERFYRFRGYHDVRVRPSEVRKPHAFEAALGFVIEEGTPLQVEAIDFDGPVAIAPKELKSLLQRVMQNAASEVSFELRSMGDPTDVEGRTSPVFADALPSPPMDTVLVETVWGDAAKSMTALYRERGYLKASVNFDGAEIRGQKARARFVVVEGPRAYFRQLQAVGFPDGFVSDALKPTLEGTPFSPSELQTLERKVSRELGRQGYLFSEVSTEYSLDQSGQRVDAVLKVEPGPQVKVRAVLAVGQVRTAEEVIASQATIKEGQPLDSEALFSTQANLTNLGIFRSVQVEMLSPERPEPLKTVVLKVKERPLYSGEPFLGYFWAEGIRGGVEGSINNIAGRAITLSGRAQGNLFFTSYPALSRLVDLSDLEPWQQIGYRANLALDARSLLPAHLGLRLDLIGERVFRPQFRFSRVAAVPTIDWSKSFHIGAFEWMNPKISLALQYELEWSFVERVGTALASVPPTNSVDQARLRFNFGEFTLQSVRFNPTLDLRDSALNPTKGLLLQGSTELTGALFAQNDERPAKSVVVNFFKASALATGYIPFTERVVLALSARTGRIFPLSKGSSTPPVRRFFLGGATSVRGFNEDQLISEDLRTQYRQEVADCQILASKEGCSSAAKTILAGQQVPSQGGEVFSVFKAELRFPALSVFDFGVFFEAGNLWISAPNSVGPFRPVSGIGLRYVTLFGALALDVGYNIAADTIINEPRVVVHFNIGVF